MLFPTWEGWLNGRIHVKDLKKNFALLISLDSKIVKVLYLRALEMAIQQRSESVFSKVIGKVWIYVGKKLLNYYNHM
jgi:hypothetical protein